MEPAKAPSQRSEQPQQRKRSRQRTRSSRWRRPWIRSVVHGGTVVILTLHAGAAVAALLFLPRGFPLNNIHAWSDTWVPLAVAVVLFVALSRFVFFRSSAYVVSLGLASVAGGWLAAAIAGLVLFPISFGLDRALGPFAIAIALAGFAWLAKLRLLPSIAAAFVGAGLAILEVYAQEAPPPSTRPSGGALAEVPRGEPVKDDHAASGQVSFPCGKEHVRVRPLLTFESRSPDATWTVLAPPNAFGPRRKFDVFAKDKAGFRAHYTDEHFSDHGESTIAAVKDLKGLDIEGVSKLKNPVYSHLNTFTTIHIPFEATITFSPVSDKHFVLESDDSGDSGAGAGASANAQMAYLGPDIMFHVVRASDAEKGPYTELAKGHLGRDEPFTIEIRHASSKDDPQKQKLEGTCKLTFKDWTSQVSTEPSPAAGWGFPQNSIQFKNRILSTTRAKEEHEREGLVVMTLAETSPGRGWHSVGHAEGTYKNRIRVDTVMTEAAPPPPPKVPTTK